GDPRLFRLQPHVLPPVHPRLPRDAAALPRVPAGVPGVERAVLCRRVDPGDWLPLAARLFVLVVALRRGGRRQSMAGERSGVADAVAATDRKLCCDAGDHRSAIRVRGIKEWLTVPSSPGSSTMRRSSAPRRIWASGFFS